MRLCDLVKAMLVTAMITVSMDYVATMVGYWLSTASLEANSAITRLGGLLGPQIATTLTFASVMALLLLSYVVMKSSSLRGHQSTLAAPIMISLYAYLSVMHASGFLSWLEAILRGLG